MMPAKKRSQGFKKTATTKLNEDDVSSSEGLDSVKSVKPIHRRGLKFGFGQATPTFDFETEEDPGYVCTGNFQEDLNHLCRSKRIHIIPKLVTRDSSTRSPSQEEFVSVGLDHAARSPQTSTRLGAKSAALQRRVSQQVLKVSGDAKSPRSKDNLQPSSAMTARELKRRSMDDIAKPTEEEASPLEERRRPQILADYGIGEDRKPTVTELYIRHWQPDEPLVTVLVECCQAQPKLKAIHFWNNNLQVGAFSVLTEFTRACQALTVLHLDNNNLNEFNVSHLIGHDSLLEELSVRFCNLRDIHAIAMGNALSLTIDENDDAVGNQKLLHLSLSNNHIGDSGVKGLARGLHTNRTLLTLNLAGNDIGDQGATALAQSLGYFPLVDVELLRERRNAEIYLRQIATPPIRQYSKGTLGISRSQFHSPSMASLGVSAMGQGKTKKSTHDLKSNLTFQQEKAKKIKVLNKPEEKKHGKNLTAGKATTKEEKPKKMVHYNEEKDRDDVMKFTELHRTLTAPASMKEDGQLWLMGNRRLISLNLARNRIGVEGVRHMWDMLQKQAAISDKQINDSFGMGLMRLVLIKNNIPSDNETLLALQQRMLQCDPLYGKDPASQKKGTVYGGNSPMPQISITSSLTAL